MRLRLRGIGARGGRRAILLRRTFLVIAAFVVVFAAFTVRLFVVPAQGMPAEVSAIVMLAGPGNRLPVALELAREHRASMLVISRGSDGYGGPCPARPPGVRLLCFDPDPADTRGEAEYIGRLAKLYHWQSVVVVTTRAQDTRSRLLVQRCFAGSVFVITGSLPLGAWPYQIAYEWGALMKALVINRSC
jgi:uncharacterized SAM-binding protein YcdF (DUF218 family)